MPTISEMLGEEPKGPRIKDLLPPDPLAQRVPSSEQIKEATNLGLSRREQGVDYESGVPAWGLRAGFSRMDTDEERQDYLNRYVGKGGWRRDAYGDWLLTPKGQGSLGLPDSGQDMAIDARRAEWADIADLRGIAPGMLGGLAGAAIGTPTGPAGMVAGAGLGSMFARSFDEAVEQAEGANRQDIWQQLYQLTGTGLENMTAEGAGQALAAVGRYAMAPEAGRTTAKALRQAENARSFGLEVTAQQINRAPIFSRIANGMEMVLGSPVRDDNVRLLAALADEFKDRAGATASKAEAGEAVQRWIKHQVRQFRSSASARYGEVDAILGNRPVVSIAPLKNAVRHIMEDMPKAGDEAQALTPELQTFFNSILKLNDEQSWRAVQGLRAKYRSMPTSLFPGMEAHWRSMLYRGARDSMAQAKNRVKGTDARAFELLEKADRLYSKEVRKFGDDIFRKLQRDPSQAAALDPDQVVDAIARPGRGILAGRVMKVLDEAAKQKVRRVVSEELFSAFQPVTNDPLQVVVNGKALRAALERYGKPTLNKIFGSDYADTLYKFSDAARFVTYKSSESGGIVAASIGMHPVQNLGWILSRKMAQKIFRTPKAIEWLTTGLKAPNTRTAAMAATRLSLYMSVAGEPESAAESLYEAAQPHDPFGPKTFTPQPERYE
jgi:RNase P protein component